jgi:hypothetical protein
MGKTAGLGDLVRREVRQDTVDVLLYGPEGVGKTTFGANAPAPLVVGNEEGLPRGLTSTPHLPAPKTWVEFMDQLHLVATQAHDFKTLVVDTLDWLEPLLWDHVCREAGARSIEEVGGGFGKGYTAALDVWREFLAELNVIRPRMNIILLGHSIVKTFKNPGGVDYDRYQLKLQDKAAGLLKEWARAVLFAQYEDFVDLAGNSKARKGKGYGGARVVFTSRRPAFDAKNRYDLPDRISLDWGEFYAAAHPDESEQRARAEALRGTIVEQLAELGSDKITVWGNQKIKEVGDDVSRLSSISNTLAEKINVKKGAQKASEDQQQ